MHDGGGYVAHVVTTVYPKSFIGLNGHASDWAFVKDKIRHTLSEYLYEKTHRRPMVLPVVMEV